LDLLGIILVPSVVSRTPPFVDRIILGSTADNAGLMPDDLIVEVAGRLTPSTKELNEQLSFVDRDSKVEFVIQREKQFITLELQIGR
jgi:serine protease Do